MYRLFCSLAAKLQGNSSEIKLVLLRIASNNNFLNVVPV